MMSEESKNNLRTFKPENHKKIRATEAHPKFTGPHKKSVKPHNKIQILKGDILYHSHEKCSEIMRKSIKNLVSWFKFCCKKSKLVS